MTDDEYIILGKLMARLPAIERSGWAPYLFIGLPPEYRGPYITIDASFDVTDHEAEVLDQAWSEAS